MYCGGERRWRREVFKEKCMVLVEEKEEEEEEEEEALLLSLNEAQ